MAPWPALLLALLPGLAPAAPQTHYVSLDDAPGERFKEVTQLYRGELSALLKALQAQVDEGLSPGDKAQWLAHTNVPSWYMEELRGIAKYAADPEVTVDRLLLAGMLYELNFPSFSQGPRWRGNTTCPAIGCSSDVLAAMPNGTMVHGRSLDYSLPFFYQGRWMDIPDVSYTLVFTRGGEPLYELVAWPGSTGLSAGVRYGAWSLSRSARRTNEMHLNLYNAKAGGKASAVFLRQIMEEVADFRMVVRILSTELLMAPQYFSIAGAQAYEGVVLMRDPEGGQEPWTDAAVLSPQIGRWFLVQTNEDLPTFERGPRRQAGDALLSSLGQAQVSLESVRQVMQTPSLLGNATAHTWLAAPALGAAELLLPPWGRLEATSLV